MSKHKALVMVSSVGKCNGSEGSHVCGNASRGEGTGLEAPKQDSRSSSIFLFPCFKKHLYLCLFCLRHR